MNHEHQNTIGRLKLLRIARQMTWKQLAGELSISDSMIYQVVRGTKQLSDKALHRLAVFETKGTAVSASPSQTILVHLTPDTRALVTITVEQDGLGAIDPPVRRAPTLADFESITRQLSDRKYELTKP